VFFRGLLLGADAGHVPPEGFLRSWTIEFVLVIVTDCHEEPI